MKQTTKIFTTALAVLAVAALSGAPAARADVYDVDTAHSEVGFQVKHLAISKVNGKFDGFSGWFAFDPADPASWACEATVEVATINTGNTDRDEHLKQDDFFGAADHPQITFKSTGVKMTSKDEGVLMGELTIRGVTKPVEMDLEVHGTATDPWGNEKAGFSASGKINRKDFGLSFNAVMEGGGLVVGDEVKITLEIEGNKRKS